MHGQDYQATTDDEQIKGVCEHTLNNKMKDDQFSETDDVQKN